MWNKLVENLRRRMTCIYAGIFAALILFVVAAAYTFIWWAILEHEKQGLVSQARHEVEEWLDSGEAPCSDDAIKQGRMLAYFVGADGKTVILDQLGSGPQGRALSNHRNNWPREMNSTRLLRMHGVGEEAASLYRYLAAVVPVSRGGERIGSLYMFKSIEFYYTAAFNTLFKVLCVAAAMLLAACCFGYWLAGRTILPVSRMYARQQQFTADASHEMRTPLAVIRLAVKGLQEDEDSSYSDFAKESLAMVADETERMSRLTENLMELARSDQGELRAAAADVDMSALCRRVAKQLELVCVAKGQLLRAEIADGLHLQGDETALTRLLVILLDNASKYAPEKTTVALLAQFQGGSLLLEVRDKGCGVSDADKLRVFDRFYRVDKARSRSQGGLGLGLSLAQAIVRQHNGSIKLLDNQPCGTIAQVLLPVDR